MHRTWQIVILLTGVLAGALILSLGALVVSSMGTRHRATGPKPREIVCAGEVVSTNAKSLANVAVTAYEMLSDGISGNVELRLIGETRAGDDGTFRFETQARPNKGRSFGGYIVATKPGLALGWAEWDLHADARVSIELGEPGELAGVIRDQAGEPIEDAQVRANLYRAQVTATGNEKRQWLPGIAPLDALGTRTDREGLFRFDNLPSGVGVDLLVTARGKAVVYTFAFEEEGKARFVVGQNDIEVVVPTEGRMDGMIVDLGTGQGAAGVAFAVTPTFSPAFYHRFACTSAQDGSFTVGGLLRGRYVILGGVLSKQYVDIEPGKTAQVTVFTGRKSLYGRALFQDEGPAVIQPPPWPGAKTGITLGRADEPVGPYIGQVDGDGYFRVDLTYDQLQWLQSGEAWLVVNVPANKPGRIVHAAEFPFACLAAERDKAGVVKVNRPAGEPAFLIGRPLPSLDGLAVDGERARVKDKIVLLCFLDISQRPSRHCLENLAKLAARPRQEDLAIIAIQVAPVDEDTMKGLLASHGVSFPIARIENDIEWAKAAWGVRSLPWLILTDGHHIVRGEGFPLNELDVKLAEGLGKQE